MLLCDNQPRYIGSHATPTKVCFITFWIRRPTGVVETRNWDANDNVFTGPTLPSRQVILLDSTDCRVTLEEPKVLLQTKRDGA